MVYLSFNELGNQKGFRLVNMNVQSLLSKIMRIRKMGIIAEHISVTETWMRTSDPDWKITIPGMTVYRRDRLNAIRRSGGVACYVANEYASYTTEVPELYFASKDIECMGIITKYPTHKFRVVITVYRPPKGNPTACYAKLVELLNLPLMANREIWILGDANVCTLKRNSGKCKIMYRFIKENKLKYIQTRPTYFHTYGRSTLDHCYTNCPHVRQGGVINAMFGDHAPIYIIKKQIIIILIQGFIPL